MGIVLRNVSITEVSCRICEWLRCFGSFPFISYFGGEEFQIIGYIFSYVEEEEKFALLGDNGHLAPVMRNKE